MKIIEILSDYIREELHDAEKYVKAALKHKEEYPEIADTFYVLANEEINHMQILHNLVTAMIQKYRKENGEPPSEMLAVYNYIHEKLIDEEKDVKILQGMYKG